MAITIPYTPINQKTWGAGFFLSGLFFLLFCGVMLRPAPSSAQGEAPSGQTAAPYRLTADKVTYHKESDTYSAEGQVTIANEADEILSDHILLNRKTMETVATGNVSVSSAGNRVTGSRVSMNLNDKTGTISDGTIFVESNHYYISGKEIEKTGPATYEGEKVSVTACDGDRPDWRISGKDLDVTVGGYGKVRHAVLWLKEVPVFYTPFFIFPVKLSRQSGLLSPRFGFSERKGFNYEQPLFIALNDSEDITISGHYMEKRGFKTGVEYRYVRDARSQGAFLWDYMDDREQDLDGMDSAWGYEDADGVSARRPNRERYWFRAKINQEMPLELSFKLDVDWVSDQDYLKEFKNGYTGFSKTESYFLENYGRGLDGYDDPVRVNRIGLNRNFQAISINSGLIWNDDLLIRHSNKMSNGAPIDEPDHTLQTLPYVMAQGLKQRIAGTPFYYDLSSGYAYYFRQEGESLQDPSRHVSDLFLKGHELDLHPRLYLPLRFRNYFLLEPSLGYQTTLWHIDEMPENMDYSGDDPRYLSREFPEMRVALSSELNRIYPFSFLDISRIRHTVKPEIAWEYIPDNDFEKYPLFETGIEKTNMVTLSLTHFFTSKSILRKSAEPARPEAGPEYAYHQFLRVMIEQAFNINTNTPQEWIDNNDDTGPLLLEMKWTPNDQASFTGDLLWSHKKQEWIAKNLASAFSTRRGDFVAVEYRQRENDVTPLYSFETVAFSLNLVLISEKLSLHTSYERAIDQGEDYKKKFGFLYQRQCWEIDLGYVDEEEDRQWGVMVNLKGLGELDTRL